MGGRDNASPRHFSEPRQREGPCPGLVRSPYVTGEAQFGTKISPCSHPLRSSFPSLLLCLDVYPHATRPALLVLRVAIPSTFAVSVGTQPANHATTKMIRVGPNPIPISLPMRAQGRCRLLVAITTDLQEIGSRSGYGYLDAHAHARLERAHAHGSRAAHTFNYLRHQFFELIFFCSVNTLLSLRVLSEHMLARLFRGLLTLRTGREGRRLEHPPPSPSAFLLKCYTITGPADLAAQAARSAQVSSVPSTDMDPTSGG